VSAPAFTMRPIEPRDDAAIATIIRAVMPEFGADGPGFAIHDAEVDSMSVAYSRPRSAYFVIEADGAVQGGAGVAPLDGGDADVCELRKMYFLPTLRGRGAGQAAIDRCIDAARAFGFKRCYIETLTGMDAAQRLYLANGFERIACAMGGTGHHGCDRYYIRAL
jgi:putative acetyltransferase